MRRGWLLLAVLFACGLLAGRAAAGGLAGGSLQTDDPPPTPSADEVNAIAGNLYCPVCANVPLDVCGTAACAQWRQQIADLLGQGYSEQQIYDYFAAQYGQGVLAAPPARGLNWLVYILPPVAILLGAGLLWRNLRTWKQAPAANQESPKAGGKYAEQLERELKERR
jgi:cytochrome c-type biogenesis protein CcmH